MKLYTLSFLALAIVLLLSEIKPLDAAKGKRRAKKKAKQNAEILKEDEPVVYKSEKEKTTKLAELKRQMEQKMKKDSDNSDESDRLKLIELQKEEIKLRKNVLRAILDHGEISKEKAAALHGLGRNMYHQQKYEEVVAASQEIVKIHEELDGPESINTAQALGNVGSVFHRLGRFEECKTVMNRALYILLSEYEESSKEVMLHRAKMLTFKIEDGRAGSGISYDDFKDEL